VSSAYLARSPRHCRSAIGQSEHRQQARGGEGSLTGFADARVTALLTGAAEHHDAVAIHDCLKLSDAVKLLAGEVDEHFLAFAQLDVIRQAGLDVFAQRASGRAGG